MKTPRWSVLLLLGALYFCQGLPFGFFVQALPVVLQLDARGYFAWTTAESILAREMDAAATPCTPPDDDEVASARASLAGFRVIDREGKRLVARPPTAAELDAVGEVAQVADEQFGVAG